MHWTVVIQVRQTGRAVAMPVWQTGHRWQWRRSACGIVGITPARTTGVLVITIPYSAEPTIFSFANNSHDTWSDDITTVVSTMNWCLQSLTPSGAVVAVCQYCKSMSWNLYFIGPLEHIPFSAPSAFDSHSNIFLATCYHTAYTCLGRFRRIFRILYLLCSCSNSLNGDLTFQLICLFTGIYLL